VWWCSSPSSVQQTVLVHLTVGRIHPEDMFLVAVAAGYVAGPGRGAVIGFSAGIVADLFVPTTFGMSALVGAVLAYCVGVATSGLVRTSVALQVVTGAAGTAAGLCLYATLGAVLGYPSMLKLDLVPGTRFVHSGGWRYWRCPAIRLTRWAVVSRTATVAAECREQVVVRRRRRLAQRLTTADVPKRPKRKPGSLGRVVRRTRHVNPRPEEGPR
jgi:cell shape-determining protein MreD